MKSKMTRLLRLLYEMCCVVKLLQYSFAQIKGEIVLNKQDATEVCTNFKELKNIGLTRIFKNKLTAKKVGCT